MMGPGPGPGGGYELDDKKQLEIERRKNKEITDAYNKLSSNHNEALCVCSVSFFKKYKKLKKKNKKLKEKNRDLKKENKRLQTVLGLRLAAQDTYNGIKIKGGK